LNIKQKSRLLLEDWDKFKKIQLSRKTQFDTNLDIQSLRESAEFAVLTLRLDLAIGSSSEKVYESYITCSKMTQEIMNCVLLEVIRNG
jgi:hypothetical protein